MMRSRIIGILALIATLAFSISGAVNHNPIDNGGTNGRNITGGSLEAPFSNPALLGCERLPSSGLLIFPITDYGLGLWSDKLALSPFTILGNLPTDDPKTTAILYDKILANSIGSNASMTPEQVSDAITKKFKGGVTIYSGFKTSLLTFAQKRFAMDVATHMDEEFKIPEGPIYMLFSADKGLRRGNTLSLDNFKQEGIWATDFTFQLGLPVSIPTLHKFFHLRYGAGGVGLKYVMGHSMLRATVQPGSSITYDSVSNSLKTNAEITVQSAGTGIHGPLAFNWADDNPFKKGIPINGHGLGVEIGGILYDNDAALSINVQNLGVLFWTNNVKDVTYKIHKDNLTLYDIARGVSQHSDTAGKSDGDSTLLQIFNRNAGEYISDSRDTLKSTNAITTFLPLCFNIGYARTWDFSLRRPKIRMLADHATLNADYQQQLTDNPGQSFIPRLSLGAEAGVLNGYLPMRVGFILGGAEHFGSALGMGFNFRYFSIQASYKAVGNMLFVPTNGFEVAGGFNINWGMKVDTDRDGITDDKDKCPLEPEDMDNFQDEDGCPDLDNDNDGIPDLVDKCPNQPEDKDGFKDDDGCPDYDNDDDGIPDSIDKCSNIPEDKDNFQDADGCPDYDNDADGVPDSLDKCPNTPEDIDGFEDSDGCPDFDNDKDGISDTLDQCINQPEAYNGYRDEDGCPDVAPVQVIQKPTVQETKVLNKNLRAINFKTASAELTPESYTALNYIVGFLKQYAQLRYEIQGHTDAQGNEEYNLLLSAARAGSVRNYLLTQGVPDSQLIAIGYGKTRPLATNATASGRAENRRVEFKTIETKEEYAVLKQRAADFREKIKAAKIQGSGY